MPCANIRAYVCVWSALCLAPYAAGGVSVPQIQYAHACPIVFCFSLFLSSPKMPIFRKKNDQSVQRSVLHKYLQKRARPDDMVWLVRSHEPRHEGLLGLESRRRRALPGLRQLARHGLCGPPRIKKNCCPAAVSQKKKHVTAPPGSRPPAFLSSVAAEDHSERISRAPEKNNLRSASLCPPPLLPVEPEPWVAVPSA